MGKSKYIKRLNKLLVGVDIKKLKREFSGSHKLSDMISHFLEKNKYFVNSVKGSGLWKSDVSKLYSTMYQDTDSIIRVMDETQSEVLSGMEVDERSMKNYITDKCKTYDILEIIGFIKTYSRIHSFTTYTTRDRLIIAFTEVDEINDYTIYKKLVWMLLKDLPGYFIKKLDSFLIINVDTLRDEIMYNIDDNFLKTPAAQWENANIRFNRTLLNLIDFNPNKIIILLTKQKDEPYKITYKIDIIYEDKTNLEEKKKFIENQVIDYNENLLINKIREGIIFNSLDYFYMTTNDFYCKIHDIYDSVKNTGEINPNNSYDFFIFKKYNRLEIKVKKDLKILL